MSRMVGLIQMANLDEGLPRFPLVFFGKRFFFLVEATEHLLALFVTVCVKLNVFAWVHSERHGNWLVVCGGLSR